MFIKGSVENLEITRVAEHKERIGEVIFDTNNIQFKAGLIITFSSFFKEGMGMKERERFVKEVTSNKYSNFKLVTDILMRFLLEKYPQEKERFGKFWKNMDEIGRIRNSFAHEFLMIGNDSLSHFPIRDKNHIPWGEEGKQTTKLFDEFKNLHKLVSKEIVELLSREKLHAQTRRPEKA